MKVPYPGWSLVRIRVDPLETRAEELDDSVILVRRVFALTMILA